ncbi:hypothetical protein [Cytobacillus oceanisediminis]|uniref:hypothetical protein n=1 Tax=Cytobacillus oceanisediminis TaxID=665099 RepID=UPI00249580A4|nr:hypothetical protein [Cytobacillus oceanisediminis]
MSWIIKILKLKSNYFFTGGLGARKEGLSPDLISLVTLKLGPDVDVVAFVLVLQFFWFLDIKEAPLLMVVTNITYFYKNVINPLNQALFIWKGLIIFIKKANHP